MPSDLDPDPLDVRASRVRAAYRLGLDHGRGHGRMDQPILRRVLATIVIVAVLAFAAGVEP